MASFVSDDLMSGVGAFHGDLEGDVEAEATEADDRPDRDNWRDMCDVWEGEPLVMERVPVERLCVEVEGNVEDGGEEDEGDDKEEEEETGALAAAPPEGRCSLRKGAGGDEGDLAVDERVLVAGEEGEAEAAFWGAEEEPGWPREGDGLRSDGVFATTEARVALLLGCASLFLLKGEDVLAELMEEW